VRPYSGGVKYCTSIIIGIKSIASIFSGEGESIGRVKDA
jgi:hypothetical protein